MKRILLSSTAIAGGVAALGAHGYAAEAPTWRLSGNANFQAYWVDQDFDRVEISSGTKMGLDVTGMRGWRGSTTTKGTPQTHDWYFGVDEAELQLDVSGTADNGLNYSFKIEINANTTDTKVADEARLQFSGGWGTLQMGDEDGAEDIMNYGGENLMGATGGFDGDIDDVLIRWKANVGGVTYSVPGSHPQIFGDTGDATKISYFSPRIAGFQAGASLTPAPHLSGDEFKSDGVFEDHVGLGVNYDRSFGGVRLRGSAVYSAASSNSTQVDDISAWSVGGIVGFGSVSVGANYTDNGESIYGPVIDDNYYWNAAASFETGPLLFSAGYFEYTLGAGTVELTFSNFAATADYTMAPGLGVYAEVNVIKDDQDDDAPTHSNDATVVILGANVSF